MSVGQHLASAHHCGCRTNMEWYLLVLINKLIYYVFKNVPYISSKYLSERQEQLKYIIDVE